LVHRLDVGTSGLVMLARDQETHRLLSRELSERRVEKTYLALVWGHPRPRLGRYDWPLAPDRRDRRKMRVDPGGSPAATRYRTVADASHVSLVELSPETGRTHQLRVHLARAGHRSLRRTAPPSRQGQEPAAGAESFPPPAACVAARPAGHPGISFASAGGSYPERVPGCPGAPGDQSAKRGPGCSLTWMANTEQVAGESRDRYRDRGRNRIPGSRFSGPRRRRSMSTTS
ncbi:MAG: RluA family pseudouridine synthase, partial [Acidobacteria bacterium]|nr:RluA family pseudouridine synthase [Acidobacteriota bacterium]